jgi:hypothetical protein
VGIGVFSGGAEVGSAVGCGAGFEVELGCGGINVLVTGLTASVGASGLSVLVAVAVGR